MIPRSVLVAVLFAFGCSSSETSAPAGDAAVDTAPPAVGDVQTFAEFEESSSEGLAFAPDGSALWVGVAGAVHRVNADGTSEKLVEVPGLLGIAARSDGKLLACGKAEGELWQGAPPGVIWLVDPIARNKSVLVAPAGEIAFKQLNYVAIAKDGSFVFSDSGGNKVWRANGDGTGVALVTDAFTYPNGMAFSPDGATLYVASFDTKKIYALARKSDGGFDAPTVFLDGVENVDGLAVSESGELFLVCSGLGVLRAPGSGGDGQTTSVAPGSAFKLSANGAFGAGAYGAEWLYVTNLIGNHVSRVWTGVRGAPLPPR